MTVFSVEAIEIGKEGIPIFTALFHVRIWLGSQDRSFIVERLILGFVTKVFHNLSRLSVDQFESEDNK